MQHHITFGRLDSNYRELHILVIVRDRLVRNFQSTSARKLGAAKDE
jgi:hypothetical protein